MILSWFTYFFKKCVFSLYPFVLWEFDYPRGPPIRVTSNFKDISNYFGIAKVRVIPPKDLFFPVLPLKTSNGILAFPLCCKCANLKPQSEEYVCNHTEDQRSFTVTVTTPELKEAIKKGNKTSS